jgi:hypothetical protein
VSSEVLAFVMGYFADRDSAFIETINLPIPMSAQCSIIGPVTGHRPVSELDAHYGKRGNRQYDSRLVNCKPVSTSEVTVIACEHDGWPCVLATVFGGPLSPKEINDPTLTLEESTKSHEFWAQHALCDPR